MGSQEELGTAYENNGEDLDLVLCLTHKQRGDSTLFFIPHYF